jgi:nucleoside 2-deoxyribosyltransferase
MPVKSVYVIGALRNPKIPEFAQLLRLRGFDAFDSWFAPGPHADDFWRDYTKARNLTYKEALRDWSARHVFEFDKKHLDRCDMAVLLMPAGKSAHLELGYMVGKGKSAFILFPETPKRYDVMVQFATDIFFNVEELVTAMRQIA